ncbi:MAG: hypothetical protein FWD21_04705, partial [Peptococcaceae bacterium]|nr:hypothetical protein [Peptococcaceae bacterium]
DGFVACAIRAGFFPEFHFNDRLSSVLLEENSIRLIVINEPALAYSSDEKNLLIDFIKSGGTLLLFGNYQSPRATWDIYRLFDFSFEEIPFGHVAPAMAPDMAFWNACPLLYKGERITPDTAEVESLIQVWGDCVAVRRDLGRGQVYAFGDNGFIKNKNLEHVETYNEGNINFVVDLLRKADR